MREGRRSLGRGAVHSGVLTGISTAVVQGTAAIVGVILARKFGHGVKTDGFFAAYGVYTAVVLIASVVRTTTLPRFVRAAADARLPAETGNWLATLALPLVPLVAVAIAWPHGFAGAITAGASNSTLYQALAGLGLDLWIDAGLKDERDLAPLLDLDPDRVSIVAGLESLRGPDALAAILARVGPDRLIVSLDLWEGRPLTGTPDAWDAADAESIAARIVAMGVRRLILLDLTRVGKGDGPGVDGLLAAIRDGATHVDEAIGGGIVAIDGIERYRRLGASAVLIGSALHDGRIGREPLSKLGG